MSIRMLAAAVLISTTAALPAWGQDASRPPTYGSVRLAPGFAPHPHVVPVAAGGSLNAARISPTCRGKISDAPDYRVDYGSGDSGLVFSVHSDRDTLLVINMPDGSWVCDDDGGPIGYNPEVTSPFPASGTYRIWVGTSGVVRDHMATLLITEVGRP